MLEHPAIARLVRKVQLREPPSESRFWRYHSKGEGHLSSVEALYYLLKEYEALTGKRTEGGSLEGLFYLFRLQLRVIQGHYDRDERKKGMPLPMEEAGKSRLREMRALQRVASKEAKRHKKERRRSRSRSRSRSRERRRSSRSRERRRASRSRSRSPRRERGSRPGGGGGGGSERGERRRGRSRSRSR